MVLCVCNWQQTEYGCQWCHHAYAEKTKLRIDAESLKRELWCIRESIFSPTHIGTHEVLQVGALGILVSPKSFSQMAAFRSTCQSKSRPPFSTFLTTPADVFLSSFPPFHSINRPVLAVFEKGTVNTRTGFERGWAQRACCSQSPDEIEAFTPAPDRRLTHADQQLPCVWSPPHDLTFHSGTFPDNIILQYNLAC